MDEVTRLRMRRAHVPETRTQEVTMTPTTNTDRRQIPLRLPFEQYEALKSYAFFTDTSINEVILNAIADYLERPDIRRSHLEAIINRSQADYRTALDKLAEAPGRP